MQEGRGAPVGARQRARSRTVLVATASATVLVDQASKALAAHVLASGAPRLGVGGFFDLELTHNPGGAFGIFPHSPLLFFLATVVIVGGVLAWGIRWGQAPVALGLVAGGGLGNLVDRVVRTPGGLEGRVVDFIHFHFWPTFNLADSAIVVGVGLLILTELRRANASDGEAA